jgi:two-component system, OmpR family, sensor kinase
LVGDLLLLARADARRMQPHRATELDEVVTEAAAEIGTVDRYHDLHVDVAPAVVSGARDELHRMVLNLIENAVKHTPAGTHIRVSTALDDGEAVLVVEDDGPGVPPELGVRVFERFVRGGRDGARGSGLGLSIVHSVAQSHGGSVTLESSAQAGGARFIVRLPLDSAVEPPAQTSTTTGSTIGRRRSLS